ncbi:hypothetical protein GPK34_00240 [Secundilactobacillus kimchicus]|uniref:hypothetical protein n=1 Tax=Secundilactobacillus kimchicus TaxID=528209 RepID=UPI001C01F214|nr:hypothetical protein [Secundilactobacillus kimchicus]MBT9670465.1 hypothetical protein [Secundilactobacillus kimchicus]
MSKPFENYIRGIITRFLSEREKYNPYEDDRLNYLLDKAAKEVFLRLVDSGAIHPVMEATLTQENLMELLEMSANPYVMIQGSATDLCNDYGAIFNCEEYTAIKVDSLQMKLRQNDFDSFLAEFKVQGNIKIYPRVAYLKYIKLTVDIPEKGSSAKQAGGASNE